MHGLGTWRHDRILSGRADKSERHRFLIFQYRYGEGTSGTLRFVLDLSHTKLEHQGMLYTYTIPMDGMTLPKKVSLFNRQSNRWDLSTVRYRFSTGIPTSPIGKNDSSNHTFWDLSCRRYRFLEIYSDTPGIGMFSWVTIRYWSREIYWNGF